MGSNSVTAIWFKERPKSDQQQRTFEHGAAKVGGEPIVTDAALCMNGRDGRIAAVGYGSDTPIDLVNHRSMVLSERAFTHHALSVRGKTGRTCADLRYGAQINVSLSLGTIWPVWKINRGNTKHSASLMRNSKDGMNLS